MSKTECIKQEFRVTLVSLISNVDSSAAESSPTQMYFLLFENTSTSV